MGYLCEIGSPVLQGSFHYQGKNFLYALHTFVVGDKIYTVFVKDSSNTHAQLNDRDTWTTTLECK